MLYGLMPWKIDVRTKKRETFDLAQRPRDAEMRM
jgi:hypothetical protein